MPTRPRFVLSLLLSFAFLAAPALLLAESKRTVPTEPVNNEKTVNDLRCGLGVGDRVVLLTNSPDGANNLLAGHLGTVVCYDDSLEAGILVSFDNWTDGHDNIAFCLSDPQPVPGPSNSHWFVDCSDIAKLSDVTCGFQPGDIVRSTIPNPSGAVDLPYQSWGKVVCYRYDNTPPTLLVFWFGWLNGTADTSECDVPASNGINSGTSWWVDCSQVEAAPSDCGLQVGDIVKARFGLDDRTPPLAAGSLGTVVCAGIGDPINQEFGVLVSWNGWTGGHSNTSPCQVSPIYQGVQDSHFWMRCSEVELYQHSGCGFRPGDRVEAIANGIATSSLTEGQLGTVVCFDYNQADTYHLLITWDNWTGGHDGESQYCSTPNAVTGPASSHWWVNCEDLLPAPACNFYPGDRIVATADTVFNTQDEIHAGATGTVICVDATDLNLTLLVSWDGWTGGNSGSVLTACDSGYQIGAPGSHAWIRCNEITLADDDCCGFHIGNRVTLQSSDPYGSTELSLGTEGTVVCCMTFGSSPYNILVAWDNWQQGQAGNSSSCTDIPLIENDNSLWWMKCRDLRPAPYDGWAKGDFNSDRCTNLNDFLFLLDEYQTHAFLNDFLNLLDNWQLGGWCP